MKKQIFIIRLDDASERMEVKNWQKIECLLDAYNIKPLVGVIPDCKDPMMEKYDIDPLFWGKVHQWIDKGWIIAMHGYQHVYDTEDGGVNPVNKFSEFAGHSLDEQKLKIRNGYKLLLDKKIEPKVFFAPGHTFDENTLRAIESETNIRIISDTVASDVYQNDGFTFIPQQCGNVRKLPFKVCTFTYHPNTMSEESYDELETFINVFLDSFLSIETLFERTRKRSLFDRMISIMYFSYRKLRTIGK